QKRSSCAGPDTIHTIEKMVDLKVRNTRAMRPCDHGCAGRVTVCAIPRSASIASKDSARKTPPRSVRMRSGKQSAAIAPSSWQAGDGVGGGAGDALEGHELAPVVVDHAEDPHREDAEDPYKREICAPEAKRSRDANATRRAFALFLKGDDQISAPDEDPAK